MSFPRYEKYKDSGVEWLGEVPEGWEVSAFKWEISRNDGGVWGQDPDGEDDSIVLRSTEQTVDGRWQLEDPAPRKLTKSEKASALLKIGDLLVTKSSGSALHIGKTTLVSPEVAAMECCYSNFMQRVRLRESFLPKLAWYLMNNDLVRIQFDYLSNSTTGLANLNGTMIGQIIIPLPPLPEQHTIAAFLDHETGKIDALVAEQEKLIGLLKEKRQAVISHAVTKGLDPNARMKDSGVEWLGEVPEHWKIAQIKRISALNPRESTLSEEKDSLCTFLPMEKLRTNAVTLDETRPIHEVYGGYSYFCDGDILIAKVTPCFENGNIAVANGLVNGIGFGSTEINVLRVNGKGHNRFLYYRLQEEQFRTTAKSEMRGTGGLKRVPTELFESFTIGLPDTDEQATIAAFLDHETGKIDALIEEAQRAIELMKERRTALISAAVTGKIDVRGYCPA